VKEAKGEMNFDSAGSLKWIVIPVKWEKEPNIY